MNKYQEYAKHEREREAIVSELNAGTREMNKNLNEIEGWADRVMRAILAPMGDNAKTIWNPSPRKNGGAAYKREQ